MDFQSILLLILLLLSINLILVGVYLVIVLRDVRRLIKNINDLTHDAKGAIKGVSGSLISFPLLAKTVLDVYKSVRDGKKK